MSGLAFRSLLVPLRLIITVLVTLCALSTRGKSVVGGELVLLLFQYMPIASIASLYGRCGHRLHGAPLPAHIRHGWRLLDRATLLRMSNRR